MGTTVVTLVLAVITILAVRGWGQHAQETRALEHIDDRLVDLFAGELHGGLGGRPVSFQNKRVAESGDATTLARFEMVTGLMLSVGLEKAASRRQDARAELLHALGLKGRFSVKGKEADVLVTMRRAFVEALLAATEGGLWDEVLAPLDGVLIFVWRADGVVTWAEFEGRVAGLVEAARGVVAHAHPSESTAEVLRARARSRTDAPEVRWRSARALLTSYPDSGAASRIVGELDELHAFAQAACVLWAPEVPLNPLARYGVLRRVAADAPAELADAATSYIQDHLAWTCFVDRKVDPGLRRAVAHRVLGAQDAPEDLARRDAELVALLTDAVVEDLERGELYGALTGAGWAPGGASRLELARASGRWMREAMIQEFSARGPAFEDRDALLELMKGGVHDGIAPLLDTLRRAGHLGAGQLTVAEVPEHRGALSSVGQRGELTEAAAGARAPGGLTEAASARPRGEHPPLED